MEEDLVISYINVYINPINRDGAIRAYKYVLDNIDDYAEVILDIRSLIALEDNYHRDEFNGLFKDKLEKVLDAMLLNLYGIETEDYIFGDKLYLLDSFIDMIDADVDTKSEYIDILENMHIEDFNKDELIYRLINNPLNTINLDNITIIHIEPLEKFLNIIKDTYEEDVREINVLNALYAIEIRHGESYSSRARAKYMESGYISNDTVLNEVIKMVDNEVDNLYDEIECYVLISNEDNASLYLLLCSYFENINDDVFIRLKRKLESLGVNYDQ